MKSRVEIEERIAGLENEAAEVRDEIEFLDFVNTGLLEMDLDATYLMIAQLKWVLNDS